MDDTAIRILDIVSSYANLDVLDEEEREDLIGFIVEILEEIKVDIKQDLINYIIRKLEEA